MYNLRFENDLLNMTQIAQIIKGKTHDTLGFIKMKNFILWKIPLRKEKDNHRL